MSQSNSQSSSARAPGDPSLDHQGGDQRDAGRRMAEWFTLGLSVLIVLALAGYLLYHAILGDSRYAPASVTPLIAQARQVGNQYVLPVEVENSGAMTVRDFAGELNFRTPDGQWHTREFTIDFLGERSTQTLYFYLDHPPDALEIHAAPHKYMLE